MPIVKISTWSDFYDAQPDAHILQDARWGLLKESFGWQPTHFLVEGAGAQVLIRKLPLGQKMAYIPKGPIGRVSESLFDEIDRFCQDLGVFFLVIEPDDYSDNTKGLAKLSGCKPGIQSIQPRRSIIINISDEPESILARMKQKTRYNIGLATKKGVLVHPWEDIDGFHAMMQTTGERDAFGVHARDYYKKSFELFHPTGDCELLVASHEGEHLAALMAFKAGKRAWYFYGASSNQKRALMPTYLLQWQAIMWAKSKGCETYDLWGVPDFEETYLEENFGSRHEGLWGVYRFKRGFGGDLVRSPGSYDRVYNKGKYALYKAILHLNRKTVQAD